MFLAHPAALFAILVIGAGIGMAFEKTWSHFERAGRRARWAKRRKNSGFRRVGSTVTPVGHLQRDAVRFATDQLASVLQADFDCRKLFNSSEQRLYRTVEKSLAHIRPDWRVFGQVSLGEFLASGDRQAFLAINSKRVDLLIVDASSRPIHVIEFQGSGHHIGKTAAARDAVKREALRRANIGFSQVVPGDTPEQIRTMLEKQFEREAA